ncbi:hypothetical protein ES319_A12G103700v1 [Gossypium barbadense]|uniref:Uncharacterized protein n=2 Tax=Gossypium TaxID=3633 RepID=A0A5J5T9L4_GOSBA|nr:hypothetical protein ES319_A12G103700v1 [Gossypium barbadense]KAB2052204.1 hypothetical protein ES319_A12G103700v1 [Gossypium barbadense]
MKEDDNNLAEPDHAGRRELELEVVMGNEHISFTTSKMGSLVNVQSSKDPEGVGESARNENQLYYGKACNSHSGIWVKNCISIQNGMKMKPWLDQNVLSYFPQLFPQIETWVEINDLHKLTSFRLFIPIKGILSRLDIRLSFCIRG